MFSRRNLPGAARVALAFAMALAAAFPLYWMLNTSMTHNDDLYSGQQEMVPDLSRAANAFQILASDSPFLRWMTNSLVVSIGTMVLSVLMALLAAYALSRYRFHGKGAVGLLLFSSQMLPEALLVVPLYSMFTTLGLLNELHGLVLANTAFAMPVAVWILKAAIDGVPYEIEESARVDGCSPLSILMLVVTPVIAPSLAACAVVAFFDGWNEYLFATTFISDKSLWVASTGLASFQGEYKTPLDVVFSGAFVFTLPAIVFFLLVQRRIVSGLASGAVKG